MMSELFAVMAIKQDLELELLGQTQSVPLKFADGMVGAIPVFDNRADAEKWADGLIVIQLEIKASE